MRLSITLLIGVLSLTLTAAGCAAQTPVVDQAGCLVGRQPPATAAVLADGTDPWTSSQVGRLRAAIDEERGSLPDYGRLIVAILRPDAPLEPQVVVSICRPPDGNRESMWSGNPDMARANWRRRFMHPIDQAVEQLVRASPATQSPIMESIAALTWRADFAGNVPHRRLRIVSDLLQNGPDFSFYRHGGSNLNFEASRLAHEIEPVLAGVEVKIDYLRREEALAIQGPAHRQFWRQWFIARGAHDPVFVGEPPVGSQAARFADAHPLSGRIH